MMTYRWRTILQMNGLGIVLLGAAGCTRSMTSEAASVTVVDHAAVEGCEELGEFRDYSPRGLNVDPKAGQKSAGITAREEAHEAGATHVVEAEFGTKLYGGYASYIGYRCPNGVSGAF